MKTGLKLLLLSLILVFTGTKAQNTATKPAAKTNTFLIQFSGFVVDQDSFSAIPYVSIIIKGTQRGTTSNWNGFFSLVLSPGDELEFSSLTHQTRSFKIPDTLREKYYFAVQVLTHDTIQLQAVDVYPWPSKEDFKRAFLALNLNETDADRAARNLESETNTYLERTTPASSTENYKYVMQAYYTKLYTMGQQPSISLLNPVAWASFIDALRKGKLSNNQKKKKN